MASGPPREGAAAPPIDPNVWVKATEDRENGEYKNFFGSVVHVVDVWSTTEYAIRRVRVHTPEALGKRRALEARLLPNEKGEYSKSYALLLRALTEQKLPNKDIYKNQEARLAYIDNNLDDHLLDPDPKKIPAQLAGLVVRLHVRSRDTPGGTRSVELSDLMEPSTNIAGSLKVELVSTGATLDRLEEAGPRLRDAFANLTANKPITADRFDLSSDEQAESAAMLYKLLNLYGFRFDKLPTIKSIDFPPGDPNQIGESQRDLA